MLFAFLFGPPSVKACRASLWERAMAELLVYWLECAMAKLSGHWLERAMAKLSGHWLERAMAELSVCLSKYGSQPLCSHAHTYAYAHVRAHAHTHFREHGQIDVHENIQTHVSTDMSTHILFECQRPYGDRRKMGNNAMREAEALKEERQDMDDGPPKDGACNVGRFARTGAAGQPWRRRRQ